MKYLQTMDGNQHCCTFENFINLQESPAGFGDTPEMAKIALLETAYAALYPHPAQFGNAGSCGDCESNLDQLERIEAAYPRPKAEEQS